MSSQLCIEYYIFCNSCTRKPIVQISIQVVMYVNKIYNESPGCSYHFRSMEIIEKKHRKLKESVQLYILFSQMALTEGILTYRARNKKKKTRAFRQAKQTSLNHQALFTCTLRDEIIGCCR